MIRALSDVAPSGNLRIAVDAMGAIMLPVRSSKERSMPSVRNA